MSGLAAPADPGRPGEEDAWPADAIEVGRVLDAWGIKGAIKVQAFAKDPQALFSSRRWHLQPPETSRGMAPRLLRITSAREQAGAIVAQARDIDDRNAAEALRHWRVFVSRTSFPTADADEFYWVDLIGLDVVSREGVALGRVADLIDTGPHSVMRIEADGAEGIVERLIPFVAHYVDEVSLEQRRVVVDWSVDWDA